MLRLAQEEPLQGASKIRGPFVILQAFTVVLCIQILPDHSTIRTKSQPTDYITVPPETPLSLPSLVCRWLRLITTMHNEMTVTAKKNAVSLILLGIFVLSLIVVSRLPKAL